MIKRIVFIVIAISLMACKNEKPVNVDYVTLSGKITNHLGNDGSLRGRKYKKEIKIAKDGTFKDTLHLKAEGTLYSFSDGNESTTLFLKNGDDISLTLDTKMFDETLKYTGKGSQNCNYLAKKMLMDEELFSDKLYSLDETNFKKELEAISDKFMTLIDGDKDLNAILVKNEKTQLKQRMKLELEDYETKQRVAKLKGNPSPQFNYENHKGGKTALSELKGKYVYIDVWATWCGPCIGEIPFLQKLEEEFKGKKIAFVSISVDEKRNHDKWKKMVTDKNMGGIQLFADNDWKSEFVKAYGINAIPRFILIDPNGNVVMANAFRPSNPNTKKNLEDLLSK